MIRVLRSLQKLDRLKYEEGVNKKKTLWKVREGGQVTNILQLKSQNHIKMQNKRSKSQSKIDYVENIQLDITNNWHMD